MNPYNRMPVGEHSCCACQDAGFVREHDTALPLGARGWVQAVPCPSHIEPKPVDDLLWFYETSRVPRRLRGVSFADFDRNPDQEAFDIARSFVELWPPIKPFLVLESGHKGNGKSMLAVCVMRAAFQHHRANARFWSVVELLERYRASFNDDGEITARISADLKSVPLLVLDDLGAEKGTDWARERVFELVDARYNSLMPTIVTTNHDIGAFDERLASRLLAKQTSTVAYFVGPDRRVA